MTYFVFYVIIFAVMKDKTKKERVLVCDQCGAKDNEENEVREWGNPYDWGTICEECDCHET